MGMDDVMQNFKSKNLTNGDYIREKLSNEYIAEYMFCVFFDDCCDCPLNAIDGECTDVQTRLEWLRRVKQ